MTEVRAADGSVVKQEGAAGYASELIPVARITSGLDAYAAVAGTQRDVGAKSLSVRVVG